MSLNLPIVKNAILILTLVALFLTACKEVKEDPELTQMEQVIAIHDEVMPKMSTISKLVSELKPKVDSTEMGIEYAAAMKDLQDSHKSMMDWMQGFGGRFDFDEIQNNKALSEEKQAWLDEEEEKVKALKEQINTSIAKANRLLGKE